MIYGSKTVDNLRQWGKWNMESCGLGGAKVEKQILVKHKKGVSGFFQWLCQFLPSTCSFLSIFVAKCRSLSDKYKLCVCSVLSSVEESFIMSCLVIYTDTWWWIWQMVKIFSINYCYIINYHFLLKGLLSSLRHFLVFENPLKLIKNAFYFTLKVFFILKIFKILSWLFDFV